MAAERLAACSDEELVRELHGSFARQCAWYQELTALTQTAVGKLALSRGDVTPISADLARKRELIGSIERERDRVRDLTALWQERKHRIPVSEQVRGLDAQLARTQAAISAFLTHEDHMKAFLQRGSAGKAAL